MRALNRPLTEKFSNTVSEQVPVLTFAGYFDKAGINAYSHLEETQFDEIIHQYNLLQYEKSVRRQNPE